MKSKSAANRHWKLPLGCVAVAADTTLERKHYVLLNDGSGLTNTSFNMEVFTPSQWKKVAGERNFLCPSLKLLLGAAES